MAMMRDGGNGDAADDDYALSMTGCNCIKLSHSSQARLTAFSSLPPATWNGRCLDDEDGGDDYDCGDDCVGGDVDDGDDDGSGDDDGCDDDDDRIEIMDMESLQYTWLPLSRNTQCS